MGWRERLYIWMLTKRLELKLFKETKESKRERIC